ncbi:MAG: DUF5673 domain-containing protein [Clostridium sp.]
MDFVTISGIVIIVGLTCVMFFRERKYKLIYSGKNQYYYIVPLIIVLLIISTFISANGIKPADILVIAAMIPIAFIGNKTGITKEGVLLSASLTTWDKIDKYSITEEKNKSIFYYESNGFQRKILFSKEIGEEVDNYLSKNRKIRHRKK